MMLFILAQNVRIGSVLENIAYIMNTPNLEDIKREVRA